MRAPPHARPPARPPPAPQDEGLQGAKAGPGLTLFVALKALSRLAAVAQGAGPQTLEALRAQPSFGALLARVRAGVPAMKPIQLANSLAALTALRVNVPAAHLRVRGMSAARRARRWGCVIGSGSVAACARGMCTLRAWLVRPAWGEGARPHAACWLRHAPATPWQPRVSASTRMRLALPRRRTWSAAWPWRAA